MKKTVKKPLGYIPLGKLYVMILSKNIAGLSKLVHDSQNKKYTIKQIIDAKYNISLCNEIYNVVNSLCNDEKRWDTKWEAFGMKFVDINTNTQFRITYNTTYMYYESNDLDKLPGFLNVYINGVRDIITKKSEQLLFLVKKELDEINKNIANIKKEQEKQSVLNQLSKI